MEGKNKRQAPSPAKEKTNEISQPKSQVRVTKMT